jgi:RNA polymerase sigma-70 factor (ECF subfamily)
MTVGRSKDWARLMAMAQAGDGVAYACLLRDMLPYMRAVIRRHHRAADEVEDVLQDVLLTIHRIRHTYDPARPFSTWLAAIAYRRSIDALRRKYGRDAVETFSPVAYENYADPAANREMAAYEEGAALKEAIAALPIGQRQAVELLRIREMSLIQASAVSGQSVGALKVSLHRAIRSLQVSLGVKRGV